MQLDIKTTLNRQNIKWITVTDLYDHFLYDTVDLNDVLLTKYRYMYEHVYGSQFNIFKLKYLGRSLIYYINNLRSLKLYISMTRYNLLTISII